MTKKISHIVITLLLVILTIGVSVSRHYCGGALVEVSLFWNDDAGCQEGNNTCSMGDCCHNEHQVIQMQEDYVTSVIHDSVQFFPLFLTVIDLAALQPVLFKSVRLNHFSLAESPPPPDRMTVLSGLQVFRL